MQCPVCANALIEYFAGEFNIDICRDGCSGIWFDKDELEKCDEYNESFPRELFRVKKIASVVIDREKERLCPKCNENNSNNTYLKRLILDKDKHFEIDHCEKCNGIWLDIGELELMRSESANSSKIKENIEEYNKKLSNLLKDTDSKYRISSILKVL